MRLGFRAKLLASHLGLVAAVVLIVVFELNRSLGEDLRRQLDQRLEQQAAGAATWALAGRRHTDRLASRLATLLRAQVTIVDADGKVVGDADDSGAPLDGAGQSEQPEIIAARSSPVGHATRLDPRTNETMHYVAVPTGDDLVLRLGVPLSGIDATVRDMQQRLLFASGLAVAAALALALVASRIAARPLRAMTDSATRIAQGDFAIARASDSPDEFGELSRALASLASQLESRIGDLTTERDRLSAMIAGMIEGVVVTDVDGVVVLANPAADRIFERPGGLVGAPLADAVPLPTLERLVGLARASGSTHEAEVEPREAGGRTLSIYVHPLAQEAGAGVVAVVRDLTEVRRLETVRRDFVANVSHELRTPVTAIQGYAETMLARQTDAATARTFLETIHRHAQRLSRLVADLLRLSELEAAPRDDGGVEPIPLSAVAEQVVMTSSSRAREANVSLGVDVASDAVALGDPAGLEQVLENLVGNAIRYGGSGASVRILGKRRGDVAVLSVEDDGPGIAPEHLPRVFERFYRVDPGRSREHGGTGLGLAIVKHLVEGMGGTVRAESEPGRGARFVVELPAAAP